VLLTCVVGLDIMSCAMGRRVRVVPVPESAGEALVEARREFRARDEGWRPRARAAAERAGTIDPAWIGPRRFLDELDREELLAAEALAVRLAELREQPDDPALLYLVGRLEGRRGLPRFTYANRLDPDLAWALHGTAWMTFQDGDARAARRIGKQALARARNPWERSTFSIAQARYELVLERREQAEAIIQTALEDPDLARGDRTELGVWLSRTELASADPSDVERGFWRGLEVLRAEDPTEREVVELGLSLLAAADRLGFAAALDEIETALAAGDGPGRDQLRARILMERGSRGLALSVLARAERAGTLPEEFHDSMHLARISAGDAPGAVEAWLDSLPRQALGVDGLPLREELRALVLAARAAGADPGEDQELAALASAMLAAGWYREARALAPRLALNDLDLALEVDEQAAEGRSVLGGIHRLLRLVDSGSEYAGPAHATSMAQEDGADLADADSQPAGRIEDLDELLAAMSPLFLRHRIDGGVARIAASPRTSYGPMATVIHPGPVYSRADERAGRGTEGEPVLGISSELLEMGRFGLFGESVGGGGPDGTVLRLLAFEERSGEHLGVAYSGTVAWCDGADVPSRPVRRGARITGAALHEGYWIDIEGVRTELARWRRLAAEFLDGSGERGALALAGRGPTLPPNADARTRAQVYAPLSESDRVRLALLGDHEVTLEELLEVTAVHEEGHLTDRTRFLPIARNLGSALGLLFASGLSPGGVAEMLEYRAQLVALCATVDPRISLAECLDGAEGTGGVTPHGAAYRDLVADWLEVLERQRAAGSFPQLDDQHYLIHQLHFLSAEDVRRVSLQLAEDRGMVRD